MHCCSTIGCSSRGLGSPTQDDDRGPRTTNTFSWVAEVLPKSRRRFWKQGQPEDCKRSPTKATACKPTENRCDNPLKKRGDFGNVSRLTHDTVASGGLTIGVVLCDQPVLQTSSCEERVSAQDSLRLGLYITKSYVQLEPAVMNRTPGVVG